MALQRWGRDLAISGTPIDLTTSGMPFSQLPPASSATGQVSLVSDVGPAPGIELISDGTIWRPRGGRQLLAKRNINPVTVQSLTVQIAVTLGPFPGGLVCAGMRLELDTSFDWGAIGTGIRNIQQRVRNVGNPQPINNLFVANSTTNSITLNSRTLSQLRVVSGTSANHMGQCVYNPGIAYDVNQPLSTPLVDFSLPWEASVSFVSCAETPVAITSASWLADVVTFGSTGHTLAVGDKTTIAGVTPTGYNGVYVVLSVPNPDTFTAALASNPGLYTPGGTSSRISNVRLQSYSLWLEG